MAKKARKPKPVDKDAVIEKMKERIEKLKKNKGKEPRKKSGKAATPAQLEARKQLKKASDLATKLQVASGKVELDCKKWRYKMYRDDAMKKAWQQLKGN